MIYIIGCCLIIALITLGILVIVNRYGNRHIRKLNELPKDCDVVISQYDNSGAPSQNIDGKIVTKI